MNEDIKLSSSPLATEFADVDHKHFSFYVPVLVLSLVVFGCLLFWASEKSTGPAVAGVSTEVAVPTP